MGRSKNFSVYIQTRTTKGGYKTLTVRREYRGGELPSIPCGTDRKLARELVDTWRAKFQRRRARLPSREDLPLKEWVEIDKARRGPKVAESTKRNDAKAYELLGLFLGPEAQLADADRDSMKDFVPWIMALKLNDEGRTYGANAALIYLRALKANLRRALKDGKITEDPFFGVELPAEVDVANPPTDEQIEKMWGLIPAESQKIISLKGATGLRRSEVLSVSRESFLEPEADGEPWILRVKKAKTRRGTVEFKEVAVPAGIMARLLPLPTDDSPLFRTSGRLLQSHLQKARERAGVGRIRLHDFRHRWATEFMDSERDQFSLMQSGGWVSLAATKRYQHRTPERRRANAKAGARVKFPHALPTEKPDKA